MKGSNCKMKFAIVTIQSMNYGNRLQNYALQEKLKKYGDCYTLRGDKNQVKIISVIKRYFRIIRKKKKRDIYDLFDLNIKYANDYGVRKTSDKYDFFIAGSDQIWNPTFNIVGDREFLTFCEKKKRIAYAASIGLENIPKECTELYKNRLNDFFAISMREDAGARIVKELTGIDVPVVLDPTMLLTEKEWRKVEKSTIEKPNNPYIFKYMLGTKNDKYDTWISNLAEEKGWSIYELKDISEDEKSLIGPGEFIYLLRNSEFVCTDSFHGTVFSILFHKKFRAFQRPFQKGYGIMSSRLDTLLKKFDLEDFRILDVSELDNEIKDIDYTEIENKLEKYREESLEYLIKAMNISHEEV